MCISSEWPCKRSRLTDVDGVAVLNRGSQHAQRWLLVLSVEHEPGTRHLCGSGEHQVVAVSRDAGVPLVRLEPAVERVRTDRAPFELYTHPREGHGH
jgi:hypothetical protein